MFRIVAYDRDGRQVAVVDAAGGEITIGRESDRRMVLASPSVSRRHARIVLDGPQPYIADEGSANGVLVNGVRIAGPTALVPGVRIDVAEFSLDFALQSPLSAPSPPRVVGAAPLRLRAQGGPFAGRTFDVPIGRITIGRAIDNDLVFDDPSLSRKHAAAVSTGDSRVEVQDLGSSNGTWINGRKVEAAVVTPGDSLRFGDLMFVLESDAAMTPQAPAYFGEDFGPAPARRPAWLVPLIGVGALVVAVLATVLLWPTRGKAPAGGGGPVSVVEQVDGHLKAGKEKLADKQFDGAVAEFERTLELDPTNSEARRLKLLAASEPQNDKQAHAIAAKATMGGRADLENAVRMIGQFPAESAFRAPTAQKVATKLVAYGDAQCKARKWSDCAWAMCRALEVVPPAARPLVVTAAAEAELHDAEKKAAKEKGFVPCKKK